MNLDSKDRDSIRNTVLVAVSLSLVCSILVATAAVVLKPIKLRNQEEYRQRIILEVAGLLQPDSDVAAQFAGIERQLVDTQSDGPVEVYLVREGSELQQIIVPVEGAGLWSTMYGYLALQPDGNEVIGLRFYEHAETPGLGDQVERPDWLSKWVGKRLYDEDGKPRIEVVRGSVDPNSALAQHQVDGMAGATLTGNGVTKLLQHWIGPAALGPYLSEFHEHGNDES